MKVLIATQKPFAAAAVEGITKTLTDAGMEVAKLEKYADKEALKQAIKDVEAIIIRSDIIDAEVMEAAPALKMVVRAGAGYDNVDLATAKERGIIVQNTPGQNSNAVAELVFGMTVMAIRNMYDGTSGTELRGKNLGIQAFGQVGRNVARIAKGFDMIVSAIDPYCPAEVIEQAGVKAVTDLKALYRDNKFVSIHIPATPETKGSIGYDLITLMPKGGVLINTARKEVIDEAGLEKALEERTDLKYVADVRPGNADELLTKFPGRVFFTPKKMGAQTAEANINAGLAAAHQIVDYFRNGVNRFQVNK